MGRTRPGAPLAKTKNKARVMPILAPPLPRRRPFHLCILFALSLGLVLGIFLTVLSLRPNVQLSDDTPCSSRKALVEATAISCTTAGHDSLAEVLDNSVHEASYFFGFSIAGWLGNKSPLGNSRVNKRFKEQAPAASQALADCNCFNLSDKHTLRYAQIVDEYLTPWKAVEGAAEGMRYKGIISSTILKYMAERPEFMSACGHIKIVQGRIFFRFGGFVRSYYRMRRFIMTVKTIQLALNLHRLINLNAEFFINTSDEPISSDSVAAGGRAGYPVFSTEWRPGTLDIPIPDPLDLSGGYLTKPSSTISWEKRKSKAVFRGATTNYDFNQHTNWRASPRVRLHKMSESRPDLLDARISRWSHVGNKTVIPLMEADGVRLGDVLSRADLDGFKYELVVDGAAGSSRTCGVLASDRVMIRQDSAYRQFFQPLLKPYVHYIPTKHFWQDTFEQIEWAQGHDQIVRGIVAEASAVANVACAIEGRALYWAVLLVKYSREAMERPENVEAPNHTCSHLFARDVMIESWKVKSKSFRVPKNWPPKCNQKSPSEVEQPPCVAFCFSGPGESMNRFPQQWLTPESLINIKWDD